nr:hypothetical protein [uncultured bacterium]
MTRYVFLCLIGVATLSGCPAPLAPGTVPGPVGIAGEHWMRFVQISDTQLADEESPARSTKTDPLISASWRPQEAYGVATLDATLQVINAHHEAGKTEGRPVKFVMMTGDICDSAEYNELRWFIDTMDGKRVVTDSGKRDANGRTPDDADNPKLPYRASGLSREIPWYSVVGNHDLLAVGNFPIDTSSNSPAFYSAPLLGPVAAVMGLHDIDWRLNAFFPVAGMSPAVITGKGPVIDAETLQLDVSKLSAGKIIADNARHFLSRHDFMAEHFRTQTLPDGHGFTQDSLDNDLAFYTFRPDPNVPVRFIAIDTVPDHVPGGYPAFYGVMSRDQFDNYLKPAVDEAKANHEFVVLFSHHPSEDFSLPFPGRKVDSEEFRSYLASQPNVIAHLCGHTHINRVHRVDGQYPYFEIETGAIIDYPQEGRTFDLFYDAGNSTVTLAAEMLSHNETPTRLSAESYRRSVVDAQQGQSFQEPAGDKYQELFKGATKSWGVGEGVPREKTVRTAEERAGGELDRDIIMTLPRPTPDAWK